VGSFFCLTGPLTALSNQNASKPPLSPSRPYAISAYPPAQKDCTHVANFIHKSDALPDVANATAEIVVAAIAELPPARASFTASVIIAAVSLGTPAFVQAQGAPSQPEAQTPPAQSSTVIRSVQVVDIKDLKPAVRSKVDEIVSRQARKIFSRFGSLLTRHRRRHPRLRPRA
jgi:hypothetical protein